MNPRKASRFTYKKEEKFGTLTTHDLGKTPLEADWTEPEPEHTPVKRTRKRKSAGPETLGRPLTAAERNTNKELTMKGLPPKYVR